MFSKVPRHLLRFSLWGTAVLGLGLVAFTVFLTSAQQTPAASARMAQPRDDGSCETHIESRVPSKPLSVITGDSCKGFALSVTYTGNQDTSMTDTDTESNDKNITPTRVIVCPQDKTPPLLLLPDDTYDSRHCVSWIARNNAWHSVNAPKGHGPYNGYVISFANVNDGDGEYQIKADIQQ